MTLAGVSTRTKDGDGGYTETYTTLSPATEWVSAVTAAPGEVERIFGGTVTAQVTEILSLRYLADVTTNTRVTFTDAGGTHTLYVRGVVDVDRRNVELQLACEESIAPAVVWS